jgi:hypothetical protein
LDAFAGACYRLRRSALLRWVFLALGVIALGLLLFSRPGAVENQSVREAELGSISLSSQDSYVRVRGVIDTAGAYRTQYRLGDISLYGGRYLPLVDTESFDMIFVADDGLPPYTPGMTVTLVGQVVLGTGAQPPYYLQSGYPPNVVLANLLARLGAVMLVALVTAALLALAVEQLDYALPLPWGRPRQTQDAPALLWSGGLGRQFGETYLRNLPAKFNATPHEARFESAQPEVAWTVSVRRLKSVQLFDVATRYGGLPAARLRFEDERGLQRHGVIASNSASSRDAVVKVLSLIR